MIATKEWVKSLLTKCFAKNNSWKSLGTVTGSTYFTLPTSYNELMVVFDAGSDNPGYVGTIIINKDVIDSRINAGMSTTRFRSGGYVSTSNNYMCEAYLDGSTGQIKGNTFNINGTDYISSIKVTVYYK